MPDGGYICLNGDFIRNHEPRLYTSNRAFRYNDALTENIHGNASDAQFLDLHIDRMMDNMKALSMKVPMYFNAANFRSLITSLLNKNKTFGGAHIRLTVYRNSGEALFATDNEIEYLIESSPLNSGNYKLNEKGLSIGISRLFTRIPGGISHIYRANVTLFMLAAMEGQMNGYDAVILLNNDGRLTESTDSNIFLVSGKSIFTPSVEQGCIPGIMRRIIIGCASKTGYRVNEQSSLTPSALIDAEEVFLTNAVEGIKWVGAFGQKRYFNKTARLFNTMLNEQAFD